MQSIQTLGTQLWTLGVLQILVALLYTLGTQFQTHGVPLPITKNDMEIEESKSKTRVDWGFILIIIFNFYINYGTYLKSMIVPNDKIII